MNKIRDRVSPIFLISAISVTGFVTGIFMIALWQENWLITDGILNQDFIFKMKEFIIDKRALFFLCLEKRICAFFLLFLLAFSSVNVFVNILFFFLHGLYVGSVMELLIVRYGIQGIGVYASLVLPHGIFYVMGFLVLGCWCMNMEKTSGGEQRKKKDKVRQVIDKGRLFTAFIFVFIGIMLESYVNIYFLEIFF